MVTDFCTVAQMVARPNHHIVAYTHGWLDGLVLRDKAIVAYREVRPGRGLAANVRDHRVACRLGLLILSLGEGGSA